MTAIGYTWTDQPLTGWGTFAAALRDRCAEHGISCTRHTSGHFDGLLLHGFGEGLALAGDATGTREVAVGFLETPRTLTPARVAAHNARFAQTLAGSTWLAGVLRDAGVEGVDVALQGVHPVPFVPRSDRWKDRWVVFSGGKLEYRKGQDIVVAAFRELVTREPNALLVTAWQNAYDVTVNSIQKSIHTQGRPARHGERLDIVGWCEANGIPRGNVVDLGWVTREDWPQVWADVDVAVFPNRSEGGTNLVAMEALAAGVPTFVHGSTGQQDLVPYADPVGPNTPDKWAIVMGKGVRLHEFQSRFTRQWLWPTRIDRLLTRVGVLPMQEAA